jgi:hypothetical protein
LLLTIFTTRVTGARRVGVRIRLACRHHFPASTRLATVMYFLPAPAQRRPICPRAIGADFRELDQHRQVDPGEHLDVRPVHHRNREIGGRAAEHVGEDHHTVAGVGARDRLDDVVAPLLDVVVGPDHDGLDLLCSPTTCSRAARNSTQAARG